MSFSQVDKVAKLLFERFEELPNKADILKAPELKKLMSDIKNQPIKTRAAYGQAVNQLKKTLQQMVTSAEQSRDDRGPIDVTAPFDVNIKPEHKPATGYAIDGTIHPVITEMNNILNILNRMGFAIEHSRQLDDDYHMFGSLNFPDDHPARDDFDTFVTADGLVAPAHTSTMQNRVLKKYKNNLDNHEPISVAIAGRVFRNEDLDARHEHTFYQVEGVYVNRDVTVGNLVATLQTFMQEYYGTKLEFRIQPFYFPFTEPSFELIQSCPFCAKRGCNICSYVGWIELLGCGMIHPNVLNEAGIDPDKYSGFAWGVGFMRMIMIKYGIEDIRLFHSGNLNFLRQFK